ncbi:MAG TPA: class I SAM-dependent methyltransferase [Dehalococcoidia bacterium]|nr:class I SAM-dependent methyltransferase [Dehalococcoidia bacterium]
MKKLLRPLVGKVISRLIHLCGIIRYGEKDLAKRNIQRTANIHDMVTSPDEPYYAGQYLHWILSKLDEQFPDRGINILDLGCGQGRLTIPLAAWNRNGRVIGVDFTKEAIETARRYSEEKGVPNAEFLVDDAPHFLEKTPSESYDCVVFTEVVLMLPQYDKALQHVHRIMKSDGLAFISFRSKYFNLLHTIRERNFAGARLAATQQTGKVFGGAVTFSWQTTNEVVELLSRLGYRNTMCRGIGIFSGIEGDPLETIARPSLLSEKQQSELSDLETQLAETYADCGRYILAMTTK